MPTISMVSASLMTSQNFFRPSFTSSRRQLYWENFVEVFAKFNFSNYLKNSLLVTSTVVLLEPALHAHGSLQPGKV